MNAMIVRYLLSLFIIPLVLSEPDLCRNPKLDSIAYIDNKSMWFFTSQGYYWYIKDKDFPPGAPTGKLPEGFTRGDAAVYIDFMKICGSTGGKTKVQKNDQLVIVIEKTEAGNQIIEFDTRQVSWSKSRNYNDDKMIGRTRIEKPNEEIEAIFSIRDSELYLVQKEIYAGVDLKPLCQSSDGWSKEFDSKKIDSLQKSVYAPFDAIVVKDEDMKTWMYAFIGSDFWRSAVNLFMSKDGSVQISKGAGQNISSNFFKYPKECPQSAVKPTDGSPQPPKSGNQPPNPGSDHEKGQDQKEKSGDGAVPNPNQTNGSSGGGGLFLIVIVIAVIAVIALIIGIVMFAMRKKSGPDVGAKKGPPKPPKAIKATASKVSPKK